MTSEEKITALNEWFDASQYDDIKFFLAPDLEATKDAYVNDVLHSVCRLQKNELVDVTGCDL